MSGILYVASGVLALTLVQQRVATGVHVLLPAVGQAIMIMSHAQFSAHSALMHQVHAGFLLLGAVCRAMRRIDEYSLFATLSGAAFIFSSECPIRYAEDINFNPAAFALGVLAAAALLWSWVTHLIGVAAGEAAATTSPAGRPLMKLSDPRAKHGASADDV